MSLLFRITGDYPWTRDPYGLDSGVSEQRPDLIRGTDDSQKAFFGRHDDEENG